jgi:isopentenyl-diphosphate Delta-isomerase
MEQVVLLAESGQARGTADKATVHHGDTPLHLAFSCYVFDAEENLLMTRRAASKATWPAVWTNSCCGHPAPGESLPEAVHRRLGQELGMEVSEVTLVLPRFRYRTVMSNGLVENEMCPVYRAHTDSRPRPEPSEVDGYEWVGWSALVEQVLLGGRVVSPWCAMQVAELAPLGANPRDWTAADPAQLPAAARQDGII